MCALPMTSSHSEGFMALAAEDTGATCAWVPLDSPAAQLERGECGDGAPTRARVVV